MNAMQGTVLTVPRCFYIDVKIMRNGTAKTVPYGISRIVLSTGLGIKLIPVLFCGQNPLCPYGSSFYCLFVGSRCIVTASLRFIYLMASIGSTFFPSFSTSK